MDVLYNYYLNINKENNYLTCRLRKIFLINTYRQYLKLKKKKKCIYRQLSLPTIFILIVSYNNVYIKEGRSRYYFGMVIDKMTQTKCI